jgi:hypothetical protein
MAWTYWKQDPGRLLDLTLTEFEITHPEDHGKHSRLEPLLTTRYIVKEYRSLGPSRPRSSGDSEVPVTEEIVGRDAIGEKITAYFRARSSEASPLVLFVYDVFWAKNCFPKGSFPEAEEGSTVYSTTPPNATTFAPSLLEDRIGTNHPLARIGTRLARKTHVARHRRVFRIRKRDVTEGRYTFWTSTRCRERLQIPRLEVGPLLGGAEIWDSGQRGGEKPGSRFAVSLSRCFESVIDGI